MPEVVPLDLAPGQCLEVGVGKGAPEAGGGETVGLAAAERQRRAVVGVPMADVARKLASPLAIARRAGLVVAGRGIDEAIEVERERDVVIDAGNGPVAVPAVTEVIRLHLV